jgi:hypothetical protein
MVEGLRPGKIPVRDPVNFGVVLKGRILRRGGDDGIIFPELILKRLKVSIVIKELKKVLNAP